MSDTLGGDYFAVIPETVLFADIGANSVRLYAVLARYVGMNDFAWPSRAKLAERMHCSIRTIDSSIEELMKLGALTVQLRRTDDGRKTSSAYYLHGKLLETSDVQKLHHVEDDVQKLHIDGAKIAHERETMKERQTSSSFDSKFEEIWKSYPRKIAKQQCRKSVIARFKAKVSFDELLEATRNYAASRWGQDATYTMHGSTFYGPNERWRDWLDNATRPESPETTRAIALADDWIEKREREHAESKPMPAHMKGDLRKRLVGG